MRAESIGKSLITFIVVDVALQALRIQDPDNTPDDEIEKQSRENYRQAENIVRGSKKEGFIVHQDVVYRIPANGSKTLKITGAQAKEIKRRIKEVEHRLFKGEVVHLVSRKETQEA